MNNSFIEAIPNFPGYFADIDGNIYSQWYPVRGGHKKRDNLTRLKPNTRKDGYLKVMLTTPDKARHTRYVHSLILLTFIGERPSNMECCHNDGDKSNNSLSNLRYGTRSDNSADKIRHGTSTRGANHNTAKITESQAREIIHLIREGKSDSEIAAMYPITRTGVWSIRVKKAWGWLTE